MLCEAAQRQVFPKFPPASRARCWCLSSDGLESSRRLCGGGFVLRAKSQLGDTSRSQLICTPSLSVYLLPALTEPRGVAPTCLSAQVRTRADRKCVYFWRGSIWKNAPRYLLLFLPCAICENSPPSSARASVSELLMFLLSRSARRVKLNVLISLRGVGFLGHVVNINSADDQVASAS